MLKRAKVVETAFGELTRALKAAPDPAGLVRLNMAAATKLSTAEKEIQRLTEEMKVGAQILTRCLCRSPPPYQGGAHSRRWRGL
jgi:hypothetical protein